MARTRLNPILESIRGKVGDLVFKQMGDATVLSCLPDTTGREWTTAQVEHRERFRQAALYGKLVMADPAAKAKGVPVFSLTVADFFNAPSVDEVDLSSYAGRVGDKIAVRAHDDFDVTGVAVAVADTNGSVIEQGAAAESAPDSGYWVYQVKQAVPTGTNVRITVTATDRPGHTGVKTVNRGE